MKVKLYFYRLRTFFVLYVVKLLSKVFFVEMPPIISVTALIGKEGKLLFVELSYLNGLGFPGGVVREGENLEEALKREVFEETGLTLVGLKYIGSVEAKTRGVSSTSAVFNVETVGTIRDSEEGRVFWLEPQKALGKMAYKDCEITLNNYLIRNNKLI